MLLVRHARSLFNEDWPYQENTRVSVLPNFQRYRKEHYDFVKNPDYIDCALSESGVQQCEEAAVHLREVQDVRTVFVSPMRRTLETAHLLFRDHPAFKDIKFIVHPTLRENLCCSCDIPQLEFAELAAEYSRKLGNLDHTTYMEERLRATQYWYLQDLQPSLRIALQEGLKKYGDSFNVIEYLLKEIESTFP